MSGAIVDHLLDSLEDALMVVDPDLRVVRWNTPMEALTGIGRSQALGRPIGEVVAKFGTYDLLHHLRLALGGQPTHLTETVRNGDETPRWRTVRCLPLRDPSGEISGAAAF